MAKRKSSDGEALNLDSLMDTVTNVVGVLMIVLIMVSLNIAVSVNKILSELPPVTLEELERLKMKIVDNTPKQDPMKVEEESKKLEQDLQKIVEELKTLDLSAQKQDIKFMDLDEARKKLDDAKKQRDLKKTDIEKLLAELDKVKALLDTTPVYVPPAATVVKLPNPRPFPENPKVADYFVAEGRVTTFLVDDYLPPVEKGLEQIRSQLELRDPKPQMFEKLLQDILKDRTRMGQAWAAIAPLAPNAQVDSLAIAWDTLSKTGVAPGKRELETCVNLAVGHRKSIEAMAEAMAAATRGDFLPWMAFRPATEKPEAPTFIGKIEGGKVTIGYTSKNLVTVRNSPKDVLGAFEDLAKALNFDQKYREKTIYDPDKLKTVLGRAFSSPVLPKDFQGEIVERLTVPYFTLKFTPRPETAETIDQALMPASKFRRGLATVKGSPNGVVWFKVLKDSLHAYVRAREISEEMNIPAGWEIVTAYDTSVNLTAYEIPRRDRPPPVKPTTTPPAMRIEPPKKTLD